MGFAVRHVDHLGTWGFDIVQFHVNVVGVDNETTRSWIIMKITIGNKSQTIVTIGSNQDKNNNNNNNDDKKNKFY